MGSDTVESDQHEKLFDEVHQTVTRVVIDVVGEDFYEVSEITLDSSFAEDIELESTEVLQIGEQLMEIYGDKVDFIQWLADLDLKALIELTLREFVEFIVSEIEQHDQIGKQNEPARP
jgi:acyl carrier protein